jgi:hypothetical protein
LLPFIRGKTMGYRVVCFPANAPSGNLERGRIAKFGEGTYYHHPGTARTAASHWVVNNPGSFAQVQTWGDWTVVDELEYRRL